MGTKNQPGAFDCYANAHPDEPMFVLLGRDRLAPDLVREWADRREIGGEDPAKCAEARACADAMDEWREHLDDGPRSISTTPTALLQSHLASRGVELRDREGP